MDGEVTVKGHQTALEGQARARGEGKGAETVPLNTARLRLPLADPRRWRLRALRSAAARGLLCAHSGALLCGCCRPWQPSVRLERSVLRFAASLRALAARRRFGSRRLARPAPLRRKLCTQNPVCNHQTDKPRPPPQDACDHQGLTPWASAAHTLRRAPLQIGSKTPGQQAGHRCTKPPASALGLAPRAPLALKFAARAVCSSGSSGRAL